MFRRALSILMLIALLVGATPQAALAMTAADALFGGATPDPGDPNAADPSVDVDSLVEEEEEEAAVSMPQSSYPTLKLGDRDGADSVANIMFLQNRLIELGYAQGPSDGVYGEGTQSAVRQFQKYNGLPENGVADSETQIKLFSDISTLVAAPVENAVFGSDTTRVQKKLIQWGFLTGKADGKFGKATAAGVQAFKQYMITVDPTYGATPTPVPTATPDISGGVFGDMPVAFDEPLALVSAANVTADSSIDNAMLDYIDGMKEFPVYTQTVEKGASGLHVRRIQNRLHQLKYLYKVDGSYGTLTVYALRYFQQKHGLEETGVADEATQRRLFSSDVKKAEEYVFPYKLMVDISDQRVYVGQWDGSAYTKLVQTFKCSTGKSGTPTPTGTTNAVGPISEWYYMQESRVWVRYAFQIKGNYFFHSVLFKSKGASRPTSSSVANLGHKASHGCIRLAVNDAKWIYKHCPPGTTVYIRK